MDKAQVVPQQGLTPSLRPTDLPATGPGEAHSQRAFPKDHGEEARPQLQEAGRTRGKLGALWTDEPQRRAQRPSEGVDAWFAPAMLQETAEEPRSPVGRKDQSQAAHVKAKPNTTELRSHTPT